MKGPSDWIRYTYGWISVTLGSVIAGFYSICFKMYAHRQLTIICDDFAAQNICAYTIHTISSDASGAAFL